MTDFLTRGWVRFAYDAAVADWAAHAREAGRAAVNDPAFADWHVCQGTWFVGVDALDNDPTGRMGGSAPLSGAAVDFITQNIGPMPLLHRAQVSVVYPGYPQPRDGETAGSFAYRRDRDAAHLDGVKPIGPDRRRMIEEPHAFILGLPLTQASDDAAPLVAWQGSHKIMRRALLEALSGHDPAGWAGVDLTETYQQARRVVFDSCPRIELPTSPGQALLLHRHTLHGVAPWAEGASAGADGRMIAYFRPALPGGAVAWLAE